MLKIILIVLIFLVCTMIGYIYGDRFKKRHIDLNETYKNIILLQNEVIYNSTPLPEALKIVAIRAKENFKDVLSEASKNLEEGIYPDVFIAFKNAYSSKKDMFFLAKEDIAVLENFFKSLGESGVYGQEKIFNLVLENLKINIEEANEVAKKNTKLYRYLGVCIGGMVSIFLF